MDFKELTEQEKFLKKLYQGQYREILSVHFGQLLILFLQKYFREYRELI